jgi:RimJ/RimL family protein N-acetyltransferase
MMPCVSPSLDDVSWPVRTERLALRRSTPADADATWAYRSDPAVADWLTRLPASREEYDEWYASPEMQDTRVVVERDGVLVGELHVEVKDGWAQAEVAEEAAGTEAELGWVLAPAHQGGGYAGEAVAAALRICFEDLGLRRVIAGCFTANEPSWRLMERLGMRRESHTLCDGLHREHGWLDGYQYALLAEEWRALNPS